MDNNEHFKKYIQSKQNIAIQKSLCIMILSKSNFNVIYTKSKGALFKKKKKNLIQSYTLIFQTFVQT